MHVPRHHLDGVRSFFRLRRLLPTLAHHCDKLARLFMIESTMKQATYLGGPWSNAQELRDDAPAVVLRPGVDAPVRYLKFDASGDYADIFAHPSTQHVTYVLEGMPRDALCELSRVLGVPLYVDIEGPEQE